MDFFRKLQEVADLPNSPPPTTAGSRGDSEAVVDGFQQASSSPPVVTNPDGLSREELVMKLHAAELKAGAAETKTAELRTEALQLNDEYAAYKLKVSTWKEQLKAARAQDRKTIETLRQTAVATTDASASSSAQQLHATPNEVDAGYTASLEEQVTLLKESVRQLAEQRDGLRLELDKATARMKQQLMADSADPTGAGTADNADVQRYKELVAHLERDVGTYRDNVAEQERANDALTVEVDRLTAELSTGAADHARQMKEALASGNKSSSGQYVKDMEKELAAYRKELASAHATIERLVEEAARIPPSTSDRDTEPGDGSATDDGGGRRPAGEGATPGSTRVASPEPQSTLPPPPPNNDPTATMQSPANPTVEREELAAAAADRDALRLRVGELEMELQLREDTINAVFAESKSLAQRQEGFEAQRLQLEHSLTLAEEQRAAKEHELGEAFSRVEELAKVCESSQRQLTKLQRDAAEKADELRALKLAEAQRVLQDAKQHTRPPPSSSTGINPTTAAASSTPAAIAVAVAADGVPRDVSKEVFAARVHTLPIPRKAQRVIVAGRDLIANRRTRGYIVTALAVGVVVLMMLMQQAVAISEDAEAVELLRRCQAMAKQRPPPPAAASVPPPSAA